MVRVAIDWQGYSRPIGLYAAASSSAAVIRSRGMNCAQ
jgi:hypothetical protein